MKTATPQHSILFQHSQAYRNHLVVAVQLKGSKGYKFGVLEPLDATLLGLDDSFTSDTPDDAIKVGKAWVDYWLTWCEAVA